ncbi:MAG: hypothetical protein O8C63_10620 [Candidatus Methanoperedens sp.]|nr:hypothetical protein [Candidatus Methanoperedens sp.]
MAKGFRISMDMAAKIAILIMALLAAAPVVSASMTEISVENLTGESDVIAIGEIKEVESGWNLWRTMIYTYSTLSVEKYIKGGEGAETLTIITEGGTVGESSVWAEDVPVFTKNETVLVFLKRAGREFSVVGWVQGKYIVKNGEVSDLKGEKTTLNDFLRLIGDTMPAPDIATPTKTQDAPGFEAILGFLGLLAVHRLSVK